LFRSYAGTYYQPGISVKRLTTKFEDEFDVDLSSFLEWQLWTFGSYEQHFPALFQHLVRPTDRCIDVGANVGVHSIRLAKLVGAQGEVIAIEPDAEVANRARHNVELNRLSNVRVIQAAASDVSGGQVELYRPDVPDTNKARASVIHHSYLTGSVSKVPTVAIDDICEGEVALIKIDVEGHEAAVVAGAAATIASYYPSIIFEYAPELLQIQSQSPFGWLCERGYKLFRIRCARHFVTGRGRLALERLDRLPRVGGDILAVRPSLVPRLNSVVSE